MIKIKVTEQDGKFTASAPLGVTVISGNPALSYTAAVANLLNKASELGGWTPRHFDLDSLNVVATRDDTGYFYTVDYKK